MCALSSPLCHQWHLLVLICNFHTSFSFFILPFSEQLLYQCYCVTLFMHLVFLKVVSSPIFFSGTCRFLSNRFLSKLPPFIAMASITYNHLASWPLAYLGGYCQVQICMHLCAGFSSANGSVFSAYDILVLCAWMAFGCEIGQQAYSRKTAVSYADEGLFIWFS